MTLGFEDLIDKESLQNNVPVGSSVLVGLSGGADSLSLILALMDYKKRFPMEVTAVHINHGLRESAEGDEEFVRAFCENLKVALHVVKLPQSPKPQRKSPEQHWRELRYREFKNVLESVPCKFLALGHNADDLAETFLYHLARGTGVNGLRFSFISTIHGMPIIRPLWRTSRNQVEQVLTSKGYTWTIDPTNSDTRYSRNLIRHNILPAMAQINPQVVRAIVQVADDLAAVASQSDNNLKSFAQNRTPSLKRTALSLDSPVDDIRSYVRNQCAIVMDRRQSKQTEKLLSSNRTGMVSLPGKVTLILTQTTIWIHRGAEPSDLELARSHILKFDTLSAQLLEPAMFSDSGTIQVRALDGADWIIRCKSDQKLYIRNRHKGERIGTKTISKLLMEHHVPWYLRDYIILIVDATNTVVAVLGEEKLSEWIARRTNSLYDVHYAKIASDA